MTPPPPLTATDAGQLDAAVEKLMGGRANAGWLEIGGEYEAGLTPGEAALVERAVPKRRAEFATGRHLLRQLMEQDVEILRTPSRAPLFPSAVVGSLSHDDGIALGAIASASDVAAIGIDVEIERELPGDMEALIVRPDDMSPDAISAFVAKEAAYKAWSSLGGAMLEHHDVHVRIDGSSYVAWLSNELQVDGRLVRAAGRVLASVCVLVT